MDITIILLFIAILCSCMALYEIRKKRTRPDNICCDTKRKLLFILLKGKTVVVYKYQKDGELTFVCEDTQYNIT